MSNETYAFSEVLLGLRSAYLENRRLLNALKKYIHIEGKKEDEIKISTDLNVTSQAMIRLELLEKQSELLKIMDYISFMLGTSFKYNPYYIVKKEGNNHSYGLDDYRFVSPIKPDYDVEITDQKAFDELVEYIYNSEFMNLERVYFSVNQFQSLMIDQTHIWLDCTFHNISNKYLSLIYYPTTDTIKARTECRHGNGVVVDLLNARISKDFLPEEYRKIIDASIEEYSSLILSDAWSNSGVSIDCNIGRRTELSIIQNSDNIVLVKRKNLKFYE